MRRENAILTRRLQTSADPSSNISDDSLGRGGEGGASPKLELATKSGKKSRKGAEGGGERSYGGSVLTVSSSSDGFETVTMSPDERSECQVV